MIRIRTHVTLPRKEVWKLWTNTEHIVQWNHASADWHCPKAENDLKVGGAFSYEMAAKDGSLSFPFEGKFTIVRTPEYLECILGDGRKTSIHFHPVIDGTEITQEFEPEDQNSAEMQEQGWQAILDSFKKYAQQLR